MLKCPFRIYCWRFTLYVINSFSNAFYSLWCSNAIFLPTSNRLEKELETLNYLSYKKKVQWRNQLRKLLSKSVVIWALFRSTFSVHLSINISKNSNLNQNFVTPSSYQFRLSKRLSNLKLNRNDISPRLKNLNPNKSLHIILLTHPPNH